MKAKQTNIRISPRKLRLVADSIRQLSPEKALLHLRFLNKSGAKPLAKVIRSALANAQTNHGLKADQLKFKTVMIGKGPTYKRWRAVSRGSAHTIFKRTSHIYLELEEKNGTKSKS